MSDVFDRNLPDVFARVYTTFTGKDHSRYQFFGLHGVRNGFAPKGQHAPQGRTCKGGLGGHAFPGKFLNRLLQRCDFLHAGCSLKCQLSLTLLCPLWVRGKRRMTFQTMLGEQWLYLNHQGYSPLWQCCEKDHSSRPKLWDIFWSGYMAMRWERRSFYGHTLKTRHEGKSGLAHCIAAILGGRASEWWGILLTHDVILKLGLSWTSFYSSCITNNTCSVAFFQTA